MAGVARMRTTAPQFRVFLRLRSCARAELSKPLHVDAWRCADGRTATVARDPRGKVQGLAAAAEHVARPCNGDRVASQHATTMALVLAGRVEKRRASALPRTGGATSQP